MRTGGIVAFRHRDFTIFWCGALLSNTGSWLQSLTIPYVLFEITGSALWVGLVAVAQFVPMVFASPLGGSLADNRDRRSVLLFTQSAMAVTAIALWSAWTLGMRAPLGLLAFLAVLGFLNGVNLPSWQAFVSDLVPRDDLLSAVTMNSLQFNAARAIGPGIAGVLLATLGPSWAFLINALSFIAVLVALMSIRTRTTRIPREQDSGVIGQFLDAIRYTLTRPGLVLVVLVSVLVGVLGNPIFSFTVVFSGAVYHVGPIALGMLNMAFGVGAILALPVVSGWRVQVRLSSLVRWGLIGYGIAMIAFGALPYYVVGLLALLAVGSCFLAVVSGVNTSLQMNVDGHFRGRVMAVRLMLFTLSFAVGGFVQGAIADVVGAQRTVVGAGILLLVSALVLGRHRGRLRLVLLDPVT